MDSPSINKFSPEARARLVRVFRRLGPDTPERRAMLKRMHDDPSYDWVADLHAQALTKQAADIVQLARLRKVAGITKGADTRFLEWARRVPPSVSADAALRWYLRDPTNPAVARWLEHYALSSYDDANAQLAHIAKVLKLDRLEQGALRLKVTNKAGGWNLQTVVEEARSLKQLGSRLEETGIGKGKLIDMARNNPQMPFGEMSKALELDPRLAVELAEGKPIRVLPMAGRVDRPLRQFLASAPRAESVDSLTQKHKKLTAIPSEKAYKALTSKALVEQGDWVLPPEELAGLSYQDITNPRAVREAGSRGLQQFYGRDAEGVSRLGLKSTEVSPGVYQVQGGKDLSRISGSCAGNVCTSRLTAPPVLSGKDKVFVTFPGLQGPAGLDAILGRDTPEAFKALNDALVKHGLPPGKDFEEALHVARGTGKFGLVHTRTGAGVMDVISTHNQPISRDTWKAIVQAPEVANEIRSADTYTPHRGFQQANNTGHVRDARVALKTRYQPATPTMLEQFKEAHGPQRTANIASKAREAEIRSRRYYGLGDRGMQAHTRLKAVPSMLYDLRQKTGIADEKILADHLLQQYPELADDVEWMRARQKAFQIRQHPALAGEVVSAQRLKQFPELTPGPLPRAELIKKLGNPNQLLEGLSDPRRVVANLRRSPGVFDLSGPAPVVKIPVANLPRPWEPLNWNVVPSKLQARTLAQTQAIHAATQKARTIAPMNSTLGRVVQRAAGRVANTVTQAGRWVANSPVGQAAQWAARSPVGQVAGGVLRRGAAPMMAADAATGALTPEDAIAAEQNALYEMKQRSFLPGTRNWRTGQRDFGKPGAFLEAAFKLPQYGVAQLAKPLWAGAEQRATQAPTSAEVKAFRRNLWNNPNYARLHKQGTLGVYGERLRTAKAIADDPVAWKEKVGPLVEQEYPMAKTADQFRGLTKLVCVLAKTAAERRTMWPAGSRSRLWGNLEADIQERSADKDEGFELNGEWKRFVGNNDGMKVYEVDPEWIRTNLSVCFGTGGHGRVHEFIPMDEIWVAPTWADGTKLTDDDLSNVIAHEIFEFRKMGESDSFLEAHRKAETAESKRLAKRANDAKRDYSCLMLTLPPKLSEEVRGLSDKIAEDDLYHGEAGEEDKYGREADPHITIKYGIHSKDPEDVKELLYDAGPATVTCGSTTLFEGDDKPYDVVKIDVTSPQLTELNRLMSDNLECTDTYPEYHPHITLAYVKKGKGRKYTNADLEDYEAQSADLDFSDGDGNHTALKLGPSKMVKAAAEPSFLEGVDPASVVVGSGLGALVGLSIGMAQKKRTPGRVLGWTAGGAAVGAVPPLLAPAAGRWVDRTFFGPQAKATLDVSQNTVKRPSSVSRREAWAQALNKGKTRGDEIIAKAKAYREQHPEVYRDIFSETNPDFQIPVEPLALEHVMAGKGGRHVSPGLNIGAPYDRKTGKIEGKPIVQLEPSRIELPSDPEAAAVLHETLHESNPSGSTDELRRRFLPLLRKAKTVREVEDINTQITRGTKLSPSARKAYNAIIRPYYGRWSAVPTEVLPVTAEIRAVLENSGVDTTDPAAVRQAMMNLDTFNPLGEGGEKGDASFKLKRLMDDIRYLPAKEKQEAVDAFSELLPGIAKIMGFGKHTKTAAEATSEHFVDANKMLGPLARVLSKQ